MMRCAALALLLLAACSGGQPAPGKPRQQRGFAAAAPAEAAAPAAAPNGRQDPAAPRPAATDPMAARSGAKQDKAKGNAEEGPKPPGMGETGQATEEKKRDLGSELTAALGSPAACLKRRDADKSPDSLSFHVTVHVMPSGMVSRGSVTGVGLEAEELKCLQDRAESLSLRGPIEDAPRSVSTTVTLNRKR